MYKILFVCLSLSILSCQNKNTLITETSDSCSVVFYNVENLFDIKDDPETKDEEFTPQSSKEWNQEKFETKLEHIGEAIRATPYGIADIIGLVEVENKFVLEALIASGNLGHEDYAIIHKDSKDRRGIDVGLLYNKNKIKLIHSEFIQPVYENGSPVDTRLILQAALEINGDRYHIFVNHWPSRAGDFEKKQKARFATAKTLRKNIDALLRIDPETKILLMGDFNDYPSNKSITDFLKASKNPAEDELLNLMWPIENRDEGSYCYKKDWGCLDQFIVSQGLNQSESGFTCDSDDVQVIKKSSLFYEASDGKKYPNRTYGRDRYYGGYSDHLPIALRLD